MEISNEYLISLLKAKGIRFDDGLTEQEILNAEKKIEARFPPDLKSFLMTSMPIGKKFPNWRNLDESIDLESPLKGILFDIINNSFWYDAWGIKPSDINSACDIARKSYSEVPKLIPIYSHRYIPAEPHENGNPIFSVMQTDIIYYGANLPQYLDNEFQLALPVILTEEKYIRFWSDVVDK